MLIERTVSQSGLLRDFGNTDTVDPSLAKQMTGGPQQRASVYFGRFFGNKHLSPQGESLYFILVAIAIKVK